MTEIILGQESTAVSENDKTLATIRVYLLILGVDENRNAFRKYKLLPVRFCFVILLESHEMEFTSWISATLFETWGVI